MCSTLLFFHIGAYSFHSNALPNIANRVQEHSVEFRKLKLLKIARKEKKLLFWGRREALTALNEDYCLLGCNNLKDLHNYQRVVETAALNFTIF
jgi:hypothetical protein